MKFLEPVRSFIDRTDPKIFFYYMVGYIAACALVFIAMIFYYYSSVNGLQRKIRNLNETRNEKVLMLLEKASLVQQQRLMVEEMLTKDPNFKIAGTFKEILKKLNLLNKEDPTEILGAIDLEDNYRKNELTAKFDGMTMQELTTLLKEIEENARITTERLEINKSKKKPKTIEVGITISTLLPKIENITT